MADQYSTLELVKHDKAANAPELDRDVNAPEPDYTFTTPQIVFAEGLELAFDLSLPEVVNVGLEKEWNQSLHPDTSTNFDASTKRFWIALFIIMVVAAVIAVGIGVGVGVKRHSSKGSSISTTSTNANTSQASDAAGVAKNGILNDTKLEAVTMSNGDRRIFFQDVSGFIRESIYTASTENWTANVNNVVATDAKNFTPLAAINFVSLDATPTLDKTVVYYISTANHLASRYFYRNSWYNDNTNISQFTTAANCTSLSATLSIGHPPQLNNSLEIRALNSSVFLFFQDMFGNVSALTIPTEPWSVNGGWSNISQNLQSPWAVPGPPIAIASNSNIDNTVNLVLVCLSQITNNLFVSGSSAITNSNYLFSNGSWAWGNGAYGNGEEPYGITSNPFPGNLDPRNFDVTSVAFYNESGSDSQTYTLGISGSTIQQISRGGGLDLYPTALTTWPISPFPFARLATTSPTNSSVFHLYHQINDTTFAEDTYDTKGGYWSSKNLSISVG